MANSITLSQSLVNDIAQKLTDGTATAEQVVLYTKGLNQLQTGNDFQAVVIGLSQSAVDTIDSANAQFQEDTAAALLSFSQTSTNIDSSTTNAVAAINVAKDTLVATNSGIASTISTLPSLTLIKDAVKGDREYIHPYERPCFWTSGSIGQSNNEFVITWYNHYMERCANPDWGGESEIVIKSGTANQSSLYDYTGRNHNRFNSGNLEPFRVYRYPSSTSGYEMGFSQTKSHYGHIMGTWDDKRGTWNGYNGQWASSWMRDMGVIVGDSDKTWFMCRTGNTIYVGGQKAMMNYNHEYRNRAKLRDSITQLTHTNRTYQDDGREWKTTFEQFTLPSPVSTGYGNFCYNKTLDQMIVMMYDGTGGQQKPLLYSFASDFNMKQLAKGTQATTYNYDPVANSKATLEIESTVSNASGKPANPTTNESNYRGVPVLCDNGKVVHFMSMNGSSGSSYAFRWEKNAAGTDYVKDAHFTYSGNTTNYGMDQGDYYGVRHTMTNDSRYVIAWDTYYYYHSGARVALIRVSDGKILKWTNNETTWGWSYTPVQRNKLIVSLEPHHSYSNTYLHDLDWMFDNFSDGSNVELGSGNNMPALWGPDLGNQQQYTGFCQMNIEHSHEMDYISPVDNLTDIRTIS